jgi:hypothetical protein
MPLQADGNAPYAPAPAVIDVVRRYRDRGLQTPFNADVLVRAGVADSLAPRTLQALRLLELIDDAGEPTEALEALAKAPTDDEYRERLAALIRRVYAEVFSFVDPAEEGPDRIRGAFRSYTPRGQLDRMVRLFLGLCVHAGIIPESAARLTGTPNGGSTRRETPRRERQSAAPRRRGSGARTASPGLPPALAGLIDELVELGPSWNAEQRDRFLSAFRSMVDYSYPVQHTIPKPPDERDADDGEEP